MPAVILPALSPSEKGYTIIVDESIIFMNFDDIHVLMRLIVAGSGAKWDGLERRFQIRECSQSVERSHWLK